MSTSIQKTVLVVDDSPLMRRLITEIVEEDPDLRVVGEAENGKVALQKVREHRPDCVLLDVEMPELSGLDTMRRLRLRSPAKVVLLSHLGHEGSRVRTEALRLGAVDVIDKPTGAVSRDLRTTRGTIIRQTLRRALGLPAIDVASEPLALDGAAATATILAVHVRDFATLCERVDAPALVALLNEHHALVADVTATHEGIVEAQLGGTTLVAFGVPQPVTDHASRAVAAAGALIEAQGARRGEARADGAPFIEVGIGIATGLVVAGEIGPPGEQRYRTMGSPSDLAPRLASASEGYGADLVVCERTLAALEGNVPSRRLDVVRLDPNGEPFTLHELLSGEPALDEGALAAYARGLDAFEAGQIALAAKAFDEVLERAPSDRAARRLLSRCRALLGAPSSAWLRAWPLDGAGG